MFTGLVEGTGRIADLQPEGDHALRLSVEVPASMAGQAAPGDSVAVNGCCLTVVEFTDRVWQFQAGSETLSRTNLGEVSVGDAVNLERPLRAGDRLGGHFVQGHVDGQATVSRIEREGEWVHMRFRVAPELTRLMIPKGSVAVDGVSLTLVDVTDDEFSVALIPHTLEITTLGIRKEGSRVNIEADMLGKHVVKMLEAMELKKNPPPSEGGVRGG